MDMEENNMEKVWLSEIYSCSKVVLPTELYYICELGKYMYINYSKTLSLKGVVISKELYNVRNWDYFRIAYNKGWLVDVEVPQSILDITIQKPIDLKNRILNLYLVGDFVPYDSLDTERRNRDISYDFQNPRKTGVRFKEISDECIIFTVEGNNAQDSAENSKTFEKDKHSKAYLSLVAKVHIDRFFTGKPRNFLLEFSFSVAQKRMLITEFLLLGEETNALKGWCMYRFNEHISQDVRNQKGYESWYHKGLELGYLNRPYTVKEKLEHLHKKDIKKGDVVLLYTREFWSKIDYVKTISSCSIAIVKDITKKDIKLEVFIKDRTRYGFNKYLEKQEQTIQDMYFRTGVEKATMTKNIDLLDVGVEYMMHDELHFIIPLDQSNDLMELDVCNSHGDSGKYLFSQNEAIFWLLKDYDVKFNESRYKDKYFNGRVSAYETFMSGYALPDDWKVIE